MGGEPDCALASATENEHWVQGSRGHVCAPATRVFPREGLSEKGLMAQGGERRGSPIFQQWCGFSGRWDGSMSSKGAEIGRSA